MAKTEVWSLQQGRSRWKHLLQRQVIADVLLGALLIGPVMAPFLAAIGWFPMGFIAQIIYWMGDHVCPQPEMGLMLMPPHLMSVCMRCYGVLLAVLFTRLLYQFDRGAGFYWLHQYRFIGATIASILTFAYPIEMIIELLGGWSYNNYIVTFFGALTGLGMGLFLVPVLYRRPVKSHAA
ncbi:MAG: DUF2085 domain-containing protein [Elainella sp. Prado103]|nr:DUF2085 domain-containing protein [Elainella sp. Prado103]